MNEHKRAYTSRLAPQKYRPGSPAELLDIAMEYRESIYNLVLRMIEIIGNHSQNHIKNRIAGEKMERIKSFVDVNHGWGCTKFPYTKPLITREDRRDRGSKSKSGIDCLTCHHNYDSWQAVCPRCVKIKEVKYKAIEAENINLKSFLRTIIGE